MFCVKLLSMQFYALNFKPTVFMVHYLYETLQCEMTEFMLTSSFKDGTGIE